MFKDKRVKQTIDIKSLIKASITKFKKYSIDKNKKNTFIQNNGISILDVLLLNTDIKIKHLFVTTYRISKKDIDILIELKNNGYIENLQLLISDSIKSMVVGSYNHLINNKIQFKETNTHTKMMFLEKINGEVINCFSSGNFNPDGKIEQTSFDYSIETFTNFTNWIKSL